MRHGITWAIRGVAILSLLVGRAQRADAEALYQLTDLGTLPGTTGGKAFGINAAGQVVGDSNNVVLGPPPPTPLKVHAFLWMPATPNGTSGSMTDLGTLPGDTQSFANGINASGQVVGDSNAGPPAAHAFLWTPTVPNGTSGSMINLGSRPGASFTDGNGINASGQVVGESNNAFLWTPTTPNGTTGSFTALGTLPGGVQSAALGINDRGQVVGWSREGNALQAFLWTPTSPNGTTGLMTNLGSLTNSGEAINASGQVAGSSTISASLVHAFLWTPTVPNGTSGSMTDLGTLPGSNSRTAFV